MLKAEKLYKTLKTKELWEAPTPEEEKLLALEARFAYLKKRLTNKDQGKDDETANCFPQRSRVEKIMPKRK